MKLKLSAIVNEIDFINNINVLEIEEVKMFSKTVEMINDMINFDYDTREIILYDEDEILKLKDKMEIYFDLFNFDYNTTSITTKLYSKIEQQIVLEKSIDNTISNNITSLINGIKDILVDFLFDIEIVDDINLKGLLKLLNVKISKSNYEKLKDKIIFLFDLYSEFKINKILTFVHLKRFLSEEDIVEIYKYAIKNEIKILLIEQGKYESLLKYEKKIYIDNEYDDFLISI